jgi:hypothetical protein
MLRTEVEAALAQRPFVPLAIHLDDGTVVDVPFAHVAIPFSRTLLVMLGVKSETSRSASGKVEFAYERIDHISRRRSRGTHRRKKAS